jgi:hypothetical protein
VPHFLVKLLVLHSTMGADSSIWQQAAEDNGAVMWLRPGLELFVMASLAGIDPMRCLLLVKG